MIILYNYIRTTMYINNGPQMILMKSLTLVALMKSNLSFSPKAIHHYFPF